MADNAARPEKNKKKSKIIKPKKVIKVKVPDRNKRAPLGFKLQLIAEIKKHDIIWENHSGSKNKELLEDAWNRVRKALKVSKVQYCQRQWNLLKHGYRSHVNRNTAMKSELVAEMAFMEPQLRHAPTDVEQSVEEQEELPLLMRTPPPKAQKVQKNTSSDKTIDKKNMSEDQAVSLAIIDHLFVTVPPKTMAQVRDNLVRVLIKVQPEQTEQIIAHAKQQVRSTRDCLNIDWSQLSVPAVICQAVWDNDVNEKITKRRQSAENTRIKFKE